MKLSLSPLTSKDGYLAPTIVFLLAGLLIVGSSYFLWKSYNKTNNSYIQVAVDEIGHYSESIANYRNFYTAEILPRAREAGVAVNHNYKNEDDTIPLPATFAKDFGEYIASDKENHHVNLYSKYPFPWRDNSQLDGFQIWALQELEKDPSKKVWRVEEMNGVQVLRYATADVMKEGCVACHNSYSGTPKKDWKVGDVRGALEVTRPLAAFATETQETLKEAFFIMIGVLIAMTMLFIVLFRRLRATVKTTEQINTNLLDEITARENVAKALKYSELKTRTMINSVQEVIVVIDKKGHITEINQAVENIFGYKSDQLIGLNISTLMTNEHATKHDEYIKKYLEHGEKNIMKRPRELYARHRDGDIFPIELTVNEAQIDDDVFFVGTMRDITHRRKAEQQISEAHNAAVESARLKSEFLANMSHEIRTPMNGVIGMTDMLMQSSLDNEQQNLTKIIKESAESLLIIIDDILDFSKIEAGKLSVRKEPVKLIYTLESVLELLSERAAKKYINLALFIDRDVPQEVLTDSGRLRQVLLNLVGNALKFTDQGHIILKLSRNDEHSVLCEIIDTGTGISEAALATLFDAFSQVDGSSSREHGGTGLGLAICKQLIELMGGTIGVKSTVGQGSNFWFTLPVVDNVKAESFISANISVLMYSNDNYINRYHQRQMEQWNMNPTIVTDINQLFAKLNTETYDLIAFDADTVYFKADHPLGIHSLIKELRNASSKCPIVLYANYNQYQNLEQLDLGEHVELMQKPIKHTNIHLLLAQMQFSKNKAITSPVNIQPKEKEALPKPAQPANGVNILLAEDNRVNQKVATFMLEKLGYKVDVALNGVEVLNKIENDKYDLVFMDCQMPEMDGYEATRRVRQLDKEHHSQNIPIIALTAHAMKSNDEECYAAGMNDYLTKPVRSEELEAILSKWQTEIQAMKQARADRNSAVKGEALEI